MVIALAGILLAACSDDKKDAATTTTRRTSCDYAKTAITAPLDGTLSDEKIQAVAAEAPAEISTDVTTLLTAALKAQQIGEASKSPEELAAIFDQSYRDAQQRVSAYVSQHCPATESTAVPTTGP